MSTFLITFHKIKQIKCVVALTLFVITLNAVRSLQQLSAVQWWHVISGLNPVQGHVRWTTQVVITVVRLLQFMPSSLDFPFRLFHETWITSYKNCLKAQKTSLPCHVRVIAGQRAHHCNPWLIHLWPEQGNRH